jgi:hypothetical protein
MTMQKLTALALLISLTGCVPVFDEPTTPEITFDNVAPSQAPMEYADILCCFDCTV